MGNHKEVAEMQETDYTFQEVCMHILPKYRWLVDMTMNEFKGIFTKEEVIQSASATIWINATKEKSTVSELVNRYKTRVANLNKEAIPTATAVWEWHFRDFITELGPRLKGYIAYCVGRGDTPEQIEEHVKERVYALRCEKLGIEEQNALAKQMFGDDVLEQRKPTDVPTD